MTEETQTPVEETQTPNIQLQDLSVAVQAIDMASAKGAYTGTDMELVGRVRNTIAAFVQANAPQQKESTEEEASEE